MNVPEKFVYRKTYLRFTSGSSIFADEWRQPLFPHIDIILYFVHFLSTNILPNEHPVIAYGNTIIIVRLFQLYNNAHFSWPQIIIICYCIQYVVWFVVIFPNRNETFKDYSSFCSYTTIDHNLQTHVCRIITFVESLAKQHFRPTPLTSSLFIFSAKYLRGDEDVL